MLTVKQGAALNIGAVLGTGVIALPALGAQVAGPASLVAWLALVVLSAPLALTFAALGARYPDAGGVATYVAKAFGPRLAAVVGWTFFFAVPVGALPAAAFGGAYVTAVVGGGYRTTLLTVGALVVLVTAANFGGVRLSGRVQLVLAAVLVALLLAAVAAALPDARWANLTPFAPHGWAATGPAIAVLVWGFVGWEAVTSLAADYRDPARDVPRAAWIAVGVVGALYLAVAATSQLVLTAPSEAPLGDLLALRFGDSSRVVTAVVALLLTAGAMNAYFAGVAKLGAALARDGALPAWFARGADAGQVPRRSLSAVALLAGAVLALAAATGLGPRPLMLLTTGSFVVVYVLGTAAAVKLLPAGSWARRVAVVALLSALGLLALIGWYVLWSAVVAAAALLYQRAAARRRAQRLRSSTMCMAASSADAAPPSMPTSEPISSFSSSSP
ncbi:amino acid permease [Dactylosporangium sp. AC04546]|uniref:amino acid permease n=1 Tax=Dactylosporangium sp. AC04546 TaxID=2862460 RepID=UPI001EE100EF|nr:amino acid permease [Dactylosporangium sp. AC04546]WVK82055.1 amino acid permease [Dactylosporangium sp. AC04546]